MNEDLKDTQEPNTGEDNTSENEKSNDLESLVIQKKRFREQRDEARAELERLKSQLAEKESASNQPNAALQQTQGELEKIKFAISHKDCDVDDVEVATKLATAFGVSLDKAYELDLFQTHLEKKKAKAQNDIPAQSRSPKGEQQFGKSVAEMSDEEHRAAVKKAFG